VRNPEEVIQFVVDDKRHIATYLNYLRRKMELGIAKGPLVVHIGRQLVGGTVNGDHKDHEQIMERSANIKNNSR
jgi:hypothetical protein